MSNDIVVDENELNESIDVDETGAEGQENLQEELAATSVDSFSMPEKFQEKSAEEIAKSYTELEQELGRKNNEVGELRKLTDQYIHQELTRRTNDDPKQESEPDVAFEDLVENPDKVLKSIVQKELEKVNKRFEEQDSTRRAEKFLEANPDYNEISQSSEFYNWANSTSYRVKQLQAARHGDFDAAEEILQSYRDQAKSLQGAAKQGEQVKRDKALKAASSETSGTGQVPGKVWTKKELRNLLMTDPEAYYGSLAPEIEQAYREGRVK